MINLASFSIHLAIAKRYSEKNDIKNLNLFYKGTVDPDLVEDKKQSHYTGTREKENILIYWQQKVNLQQFLLKKDIESDYQKGIFLHLITDYLFFNDFFDKNYIKKTSYNSFIQDLYYSYDKSNKYLSEKYKLDIREFEEQLNNNIKRDKFEKQIYINENNLTNLFEQEVLDNFIERVSNINLENYREKILSHGGNVLP
jgi:hypothetical protein